MTAEENGRHFLTAGEGLYAGHYNIGYWPWELSEWPKDWRIMLGLVDEVWVSSWHTYRALADICPKILLHMPMAVELTEVTHFHKKVDAREHFGLPVTATLFCFSFDLNSSIHRKNPQACLDAFLKAFPKNKFSDDQVGLVIKCHKPKDKYPGWDRIKHLASLDSRMHIIEGTLPKPELLALYKACDCFLSLHRAEGFGRGIAEALRLGLHVIATGYSGNVDFCKPPHADLVNYTLIPVGEGQYPHGEGQVWADPDVAHAAALMYRFYEQHRFLPIRTNWPEFSAAVIGAQYKKRLEEIRMENPQLFSL
jgi:glycosyltransferase involved in cell wall biosynthesis